MATRITVNVTRGSQPVPNGQGLVMRIENMSQKEASYYGGEAPYMRYYGFIRTAAILQQKDLLQDLYTIDAQTGIGRRYRIINDPEGFPNGHWELVLDRVLGTPN